MITRSKGIAVPGWHGPRPGGGGTGITEELDATVERAAHLLQKWAGEDVEIRFNSDRQSGGAFTKNTTTDEVGISVWSQKGALVVHVFAGVNCLLDESLATSGNFGHEYAYVEVAGVEAGIAWIGERCKRERTIRVTPKEIAKWRKRRIERVAVGGSKWWISFFEAVQQVGGHRPEGCETSEALAEWFQQREPGISPRDALDVARAVFKILPKEKK